MQFSGEKKNSKAILYSSPDVKPVVFYSNADLLKTQIIE